MATFHPRWFLHSVRGRLTLLVIALIVPALLLAAALMYRAYQNERDAIANRLLATVRAVSGVVDRELHEAESVLNLLAATRALNADDFDGLDAVARTGLTGNARWFVLTDASGQQLVNTRVPRGAPLPRNIILPEVAAALANGETYVSNLIEGPVAQSGVLHVTRPVRRADRILYTLSIVTQPADLAVALKINHYTDAAGLVAIVDRNDVIIARSRNPGNFIGKPVSPGMAELLRTHQESVQDTVTLDGVPVITAFHRAPRSGWVTVVSVPRAHLLASLRQMMWLGLALSAVLLATAGALAAWILRGVTRGVDSLVAGSAAIARGDSLHFEPSGLRETDFVGAAMSRTAQHLRQTGEQLKATLARLNFSLSSLAIGDWQWSPDRQHVQLSERAAAIYGLDPQRREFARSELRPLIHPDDLDAVRRAAETATRLGSDYRAEYRVQHPTLGQRWVAVTGRPVPHQPGEPAGLVGVVQDITDLKRAAELLRTQNEELEQRVAERTQRLRETIGELEAFSYSISHDMRAPLRSMHSYAQLLQTEHADQLSPAARHYLERINVNAARLELLVRDVLAYSRVAKEQIETRPVDLDRFVRELIQQWPDSAAKSAFVIHGELPAVLAHQAYLSQILSNLIGNALKFVAPGTAPRVEIFAEPAGTNVKISVRDHGIGIDPADHERIFQIFGRVNPEAAYDGTGIGLAIVRKAVQRMGGELGVDSVVGQGATFWFTLPRA